MKLENQPKETLDDFNNNFQPTNHLFSQGRINILLKREHLQKVEHGNISTIHPFENTGSSLRFGTIPDSGNSLCQKVLGLFNRDKHFSDKPPPRIFNFPVNHILLKAF